MKKSELKAIIKEVTLSEDTGYNYGILELMCLNILKTSIKSNWDKEARQRDFGGDIKFIGAKVDTTPGSIGVFKFKTPDGTMSVIITAKATK